jgi:hypothetical protein
MNLSFVEWPNRKMQAKMLLTFIIYLFMLSMAFAQSKAQDKPVPITFKSGNQQVMLLEMYSSQGCSSCPPAEVWLNKLVFSKDLWSRLIPVVFHVDYWDYLGWKDPFSHPAFSNRQAELKRQGLIRSVYTPGFTVNGREWRGWFSGKPLPNLNQPAGNLIIEINHQQLMASYSEFDPKQRLNIALLGFNMITSVTAGENHKRVLEQEFVVLDYQKLYPENDLWKGSLRLDEYPNNQLGVAAWVTQDNSLTPLQAVGGKLPRQQTVSINKDGVKLKNNLKQYGFAPARFLF